MNDLIGLKRAWGTFPGDGSGTVDCCALAAEVRKRLGYWDYGPELREIFAQYSDETLPKNFIARWLLKNGTRIATPELHAIALLPSPGVGALGTVLGLDDVLFIAPSGYVVRGPLPADFNRYFRLNK